MYNDKVLLCQQIGHYNVLIYTPHRALATARLREEIDEPIRHNQAAHCFIFNNGSRLTITHPPKSLEDLFNQTAGACYHQIRLEGEPLPEDWKECLKSRLRNRLNESLALTLWENNQLIYGA